MEWSELGWAVTAVLGLALLAALHRIQRLRAHRCVGFAHGDPGPLDDAGLRNALGPRGPFPASPTIDRVQDAFERLMRERDAKLGGLSDE